MGLEMGDLAIAYRIYPDVSKVPPIFSEDKLKLSELCLKSFRKSLGNLRIRMWVLLDNCPLQYDEMFKKYFIDDELELIHLNGIGNAGTFNEQLKILTGQTFSEYIYFAEDDYFYLPETMVKLLDFLRGNPGIDFLTPYDHSDYYKHPLHKYKSDKIHFQDFSMKSVSTTTMTFLTTKTALKNTYHVFETYVRKNYDASLWLSLTKKNIFNPCIYFCQLIRNKEIAKIFVKMWMMCGKQILTGKKRKLYAPVISFATHMDDVHLAPEIDWEYEFKKFL